MKKIIKKSKFRVKTSLCLLAMFLLLASGSLFALAANSVEIINDVNVSANTGNKEVNNGEIKTGDANAKAEVKTIINGKSIDPIDIEVESKEGEERNIKVKNEIIVKDDKAEVKSEVQTDSESYTQDYEVDLKDIENEANNEEEEATISKILNWFSNLIENLFASIGNIFNFF